MEQTWLTASDDVTTPSAAQSHSKSMSKRQSALNPEICESSNSEKYFVCIHSLNHSFWSLKARMTRGISGWPTSERTCSSFQTWANCGSCSTNCDVTWRRFRRASFASWSSAIVTWPNTPRTVTSSRPSCRRRRSREVSMNSLHYISNENYMKMFMYMIWAK